MRPIQRATSVPNLSHDHRTTHRSAAPDGYVCPSCLGALTASNTAFECGTCKTRIPIAGRIVIFNGDLHPVGDAGTGEALAPQSGERTADGAPERAATTRLLDLRSTSHVLQIAYGPAANLAADLARIVRRVDIVGSDLGQLNQMTAEATGADERIHVACANAVPHLPFAPESFDVVLLHDNVDAQFATSRREAGHQQLHLIHEGFRVLRPGGQFSLVGANLLAASALVGAEQPERHRFDQKARRPRRTYGGHRRALKRSGFRAIRGYVGHPDLQMPRYVLPVEAWDVPKSVWNATCRAVFAPLTNRGLVPRLKSIAATAARRPLARRLGTEFQLVGTKPDAARRPNDEAVDGISLIDRIVRTALDESARPIMLLIRATNVLVVPVHHGRREQRAFLKLPLSPPGTVAQERNWRSIELLYRRYPDAISAPRPLARGELEGQPYFIESALLGTAGSRLRADRSRLVALACDLITRLHVQTRTDTPAAAKRTWHERVAAMRRRPSVGSCSGFEELAGAFLDRIRDVPFSVFSHNDYYLENVIFADPDEPSGILDWDSADPQGLPGPDVLHLLSSAAMQQHGLTRRRVLERWLAGQLLEARAPFDHYLRGLKLPNRIATWLIIYCLVEMWRLTVQEDYFPASSQFRQNIENVMHDLCEVGLDATRHIDS